MITRLTPDYIHAVYVAPPSKTVCRTELAVTTSPHGMQNDHCPWFAITFYAHKDMLYMPEPDISDCK